MSVETIQTEIIAGDNLDINEKFSELASGLLAYSENEIFLQRLFATNKGAWEEVFELCAGLKKNSSCIRRPRARGRRYFVRGVVRFSCS